VTNKLALVVAVVLGVLSILGIRAYVEKMKQDFDNRVAPVELPVAAREVNAGELMTKSDITMKSFPRAVVEGIGDSYYKTPEEVLAIVPKVVVPSIHQNQILQQYHFTKPRINRKAMALDKEHRALTIPITPMNSIAGMLRPGDKIDIVVTQDFKDQGAMYAGNKPLRVTTAMLRNITVLATDNVTEPESTTSDYTTITLKLTPLDVNKLTLAMDMGWPFHIVKRDETSTEVTEQNLTTGDHLWMDVEAEVRKFYQEKSQRNNNR
jgi:pilus assembly protein CpaB